MTGGESEEERSLYLLSICLWVIPPGAALSLLSLDIEASSVFWETKVKLLMLEMLSDLDFFGTRGTLNGCDLDSKFCSISPCHTSPSMIQCALSVIVYPYVLVHS